MLQGATPLNMDAKGRVAIPAKHRSCFATDTGEVVVVTAHPHGCLLMYPVNEWAPIKAQLVDIPSLDRTAAKLKRLMLGYADELTLDSAGRIVVPPALREYAKLKDRLCMVGQGRNFELWADADWAREMAQAAEIPPEAVAQCLPNLVL